MRESLNERIPFSLDVRFGSITSIHGCCWFGCFTLTCRYMQTKPVRGRYCGFVPQPDIERFYHANWRVPSGVGRTGDDHGPLRPADLFARAPSPAPRSPISTQHDNATGAEACSKRKYHLERPTLPRRRVWEGDSLKCIL
jgi:hypothetical protein